MSFENIKNQFPILNREVNGEKIVYLDNAATTQKPQRVIDKLTKFYEFHNANIHRGLHALSMESSEMYEYAHTRAADFIKAENMEEIIFTRNTTESLNLIAYGWGEAFLEKGDVVVVSEMEHHSNIVPWQILQKKIGIEICWIKVNEEGLLDIDSYKDILEENRGRVKVVSVLHISNVLGTVNPIKSMVELAHEAGAVFVLDAAQSAARYSIDVNELDIDFLALSSHKMYGPTGIGVLYGKKKLLERMKPWMGGGDMISRVTQEEFDVNELPWKFEAGTPNIADGVVFAEAIDFLEGVGLDEIQSHEHELICYGYDELSKLDFVNVIGPVEPDYRMGVLAFEVEDVHPHDLSSLLNNDGIAIRAGHHCAMPLHIKLGIRASARASLAIYNTKDDIDLLVKSIAKAKKTFE